jgi:hypothetical protein
MPSPVDNYAVLTVAPVHHERVESLIESNIQSPTNLPSVPLEISRNLHICNNYSVRNYLLEFM